MAKIVLGKRPLVIKKKVSVQLPGGETGEINVTYKYRTRKEFAAFMDEMFKDAGVSAENQTDDEVKLTMAAALAKSDSRTVEYIMQIVEGWDLDEAFSRKSVEQLCDELPGASMALVESYRSAVLDGRLGN